MSTNTSTTLSSNNATIHTTIKTTGSFGISCYFVQPLLPRDRRSNSGASSPQVSISSHKQPPRCTLYTSILRQVDLQTVPLHVVPQSNRHCRATQPSKPFYLTSSAGEKHNRHGLRKETDNHCGNANRGIFPEPGVEMIRWHAPKARPTTRFRGRRHVLAPAPTRSARTRDKYKQRALRARPHNRRAGNQ